MKPYLFYVQIGRSIVVNDKYHDQIKGYIELNGATGVNELSSALDIPLSTLQYYLNKTQNYFKKNETRKWVLPEDYDDSEQGRIANSSVDVMASSLKSVTDLLNAAIAQLNSSNAVLPLLKNVSTPVAVSMHHEIVKTDKLIKDLNGVLKSNLSKIPEEYRDLVKGLDMYKLMLTLGRKYADAVIIAEIADLITEQSDTLSDEVLKVLEEYQS